MHPTIVQVTTSPGGESTSDEQHGEILKASSVRATQIQVDMPVTSLDGERIGKVKEVRETEFLIDRPLARDLWVPLSAVLAAEDYTPSVHGPLDEQNVVLEVSAAHIDKQGWRHA
jgi:hypothetical protein